MRSDAPFPDVSELGYQSARSKALPLTPYPAWLSIQVRQVLLSYLPTLSPESVIGQSNPHQYIKSAVDAYASLGEEAVKRHGISSPLDYAQQDQYQ